VVEQHLQEWDLAKLDLPIVENVGNLLCPTGYDLGEAAKTWCSASPKGAFADAVHGAGGGAGAAAIVLIEG